MTETVDIRVPARCTTCGAELKPDSGKCWLCSAVRQGDTLAPMSDESYQRDAKEKKRGGCTTAMIMVVLGVVALGFSAVTAGLSLVLYCVAAVFLLGPRFTSGITLGTVILSVISAIGILFGIVASVVGLLFLICAVGGSPNFH